MVGSDRGLRWPNNGIYLAIELCQVIMANESAAFNVRLSRVSGLIPGHLVFFNPATRRGLFGPVPIEPRPMESNRWPKEHESWLPS